tara:strand:+ start:652 stop:855 length:204 start_codon:yes stop_codon:yes gene_type:complete
MPAQEEPQNKAEEMVEDDVQLLARKGFKLKEAFFLRYERARWQEKLEDECRGEATTVPGWDSDGDEE